MISYVASPNLPEGKVSELAVGRCPGNILSAIEHTGTRCIVLPDNPNLAEPVKAHADMSFFYCGAGAAVLSRYLYDEWYGDSGLPFAVRAGLEQSQTYPDDVSLNALLLGNLLFAREESLDTEIKKYAAERGIRVINTAQGYARCSACVVDEKHIITADGSLSDAAEKNGIIVLKIAPGFFRLPGYEYGFIGGSTFKLSKNVLAFTGTLDGCSDRERILSFLAEQNVSPCFLTDSPCTDIGGAIPLTEK